MLSLVWYLILACHTEAYGTGWDFSKQFEAGLQHSYLTDKKEVSRSRGYLLAETKGTTSSGLAEGAEWQILLGGWVVGGSEAEIELRETGVRLIAGNFKGTVGFQTLSWGQSFAFYVSDLVNPKDFRDPLMTEPEWLNLPVFMVNLEYFFSSGGVQLFWTPIPRNNKYPLARSSFDVISERVPGAIVRDPPEFSVNDLSNSEFGGKLNYVFDFGLEVSPFALTHWSRKPYYKLTPTVGGVEVSPLITYQQSFGTGLSFDLNRWIEGAVFRSDLVGHANSPDLNKTATEFGYTGGFEAVTGVDWVSSGGLSLGGQWIGIWEGSESVRAASFKVGKKFWNDRVEAVSLLTFGLGRHEAWFQPKLVGFFSEAWTAEIRGDFIDADANDSKSAFSPLRGHDRVLFLANYKF